MYFNIQVDAGEQFLKNGLDYVITYQKMTATIYTKLVSGIVKSKQLFMRIKRC